jgi:hypothetical protein
MAGVTDVSARDDEEDHLTHGRLFDAAVSAF